ncbi:EAL domain-containing protein [Methyloceanibacter sp.]|uniref:EAL domain-containing protein n=1 Tax=Methyloceanibacter sp. TaxID=1965321 RepID=UPI002D46895D|nr:EAL domain-containing protein [Methyloceanibacter sp.]HZP09058.1 EAL domain-containing protein [Methyloceanibacter sp.]
MLDVIVLIAMAVTATAFAAGLVANSGVALIPGIIAGAALYLVMAASYLMISRQTKTTPVATRLQELEEALEIIDSDLQRIDRVEDEVARLELLTDRVERLDQALGSLGPGDLGGTSRDAELAEAFQQVHTRIEAVRADLAGEAKNEREKIAGDLRKLEGLIKQLSEELSATAAKAESAIKTDVLAESPGFIAARAEPPEPPEPRVEIETVAVYDIAAPEAAGDKEPVSAKPAEERPIQGDMLDLLNDAIEGGRLDLYLQPIVTLPERKLRYYEGYTRLRTASEEIVMPRDYLPVAERERLMPIVDNVLLVKSVQLLRRLRSDSRVKGVFCNISIQSLLDADFFPELVEFMEENSGLSENLVFEVSQPGLLGLTRGELSCFDTLGSLGFGFSLDHVGDLDIDFAGLRDRSFRFVKVDAKTFLHDMKEKGASLPASDMKSYVDGFGLKLIVEKVEDEADVGKLIDYGVELAEGFLFGEPKAMSPQFVREIESADAA